MVAAQQGNETILKLLLSRRPDLDLTDKYGKKAIDRASSQAVAYLLEAQSVTQQLVVPRSKEKEKSGARTTRRAQSRAEATRAQGSGRVRRQHSESRSPSPDGDKREKVLGYYRAKFMEKIAVLAKRLSKGSSEQLEQILEEEMGKGETLLRGVAGEEMGVLTERVKEQLNHRIESRFREIGATLPMQKKGFGDIRPCFPTRAKTVAAAEENLPENKEGGKNPYKDMVKVSRLTHSIDSMLADSKDLSGSQTFALALSKEERETYEYLWKELTKFLSSQMNAATQNLAAENRAILAKLLPERMARTEQNLRTEVRCAVSKMSQALAKRIDSLLDECAFRSAKATNKMPAVVSKETATKPLPPEGRFADLQSDIARIDEQYKQLLVAGPISATPAKKRSRSRGAAESRTEAKGVVYALRYAGAEGIEERQTIESRRPGSVAETSRGTPQNYYKSMLAQAKEGTETGVDYRYVKKHIARVTPSRCQSERGSTSMPHSPVDSRKALSPVSNEPVRESLLGGFQIETREMAGERQDAAGDPEKELAIDHDMDANCDIPGERLEELNVDTMKDCFDNLAN